MMLRRLALAALLALTPSIAWSACSGTPAGNKFCASPPSGAGPINPRSIVNGDLPSSIDAAKIGGGSVSTTEFDRLNGITAFGQSIIDDADEAAFKATVNLEIGTDVQAFDADLATLAAPTNWRVFYSNGSGAITQLALGADGTFLKSNGASSAPTFATPAGSGDVSKVGTPVNNQLGVWTGDGTLEGDAALTFDTTADDLAIAASGNLLFGAVTILDDAAGTMTLSNIDAVDATTESTVEASIDTLANLASAGGRAVAFADAGADAVWGWDDSANTYTNLSASDALTAIGGQGLDSDLTSWAGVTRASGFDTFTATPSSANLIALMTDETGTGANVFANTPTLVTPNIGAATGTSLVISGIYQAGNGAVGGPAYGFSADPDTGMYGNGADSILWAVGGTTRSVMTTTAYRPNTNDGIALGAATVSFADLFLASGGVINWNNGNATLTHSAGLLTSNVPLSLGTSNALTAGTIELGAASDTTLSRSAAGVLAVESKALWGLETIAIPAGGWTSETTTGCAAGSTELGNSIMQVTMDCDGATQEGMQHITPQMPKSWNEGTVTARISWTNASGTGDVIWLVSCAAVSDDDVMNASFGTEVSVTDSVTAAADLMITPVTSAITCGNTPAEGDAIVWRIQRDADAAGDTLNSVDAKFLGADIFYTTNAPTDD